MTTIPPAPEIVPVVALVEPILALTAFAFAMSITPGPNNLILAASGAAYGFRRSVPNMLGISVGFSALLILVGLFGEALLAAVPGMEGALRVVGTVYLLWLAWKIGTAGRPAAGEGAAPLTFLQAALFQFVNPKAWAMAVTAHAAFRIPALGELGSVLAVTAIFATVNLPCVSAWAGFGTAIGTWLRSDRALRLFNGTLGILTAGSAALVFV